MNAPGSLDEITQHLNSLPTFDRQAAAQAQAHDLDLTKPQGSLGRLEDLASWISGWQGAHPPKADVKQICIFAANHGVAAKGVSAFPSDVTAQMVTNFKHGGAAINQLARVAGATLDVIDVGVEDPTADFSERPAMDEQAFLKAFGAGWQALGSATDILVVGEMGIGNTTSAAALALAFLGGKARDWVGPGTGIDSDRMAAKTGIVEDAVKRHGNPAPLTLFAALGGKEIAAMAGAILHARMRRVPLILDGYIASAALLPLKAIEPAITQHCWPGHVSAEPAHRALLTRLDLRKPLLDLGMRLGEGSGAALALNLVNAAIACHNGMATFSSAGVSEKGAP